MRRREIERFFKVLDQELGYPAEVILTGAAWASYFGHVRPSLDVDFEIRPLGRKRPDFNARLAKALQRTAESTGLAYNYSENIEGWSQLKMPGYRTQASQFKKVGALQIKFLSPEHWTIGKMGRFLQPDVQDMVRVLRTQRIPAKKLTGLWHRVLRESPASLELGQFRKQVIYFIKKYGKRLWGPQTDLAALLKPFKE